ncbi:MAG: DUF3618 domain-containing protein [Frankia sp.]
MPQDPAIIQRQIENTRAELAQTVDAIAEIVSPKRVAGRAAVQVRERIDHLKERVRPSDGGPAGLPSGAGRPALPAGGVTTSSTLTASGGGEVTRVVRWDRVAIAGGVLFLLAVLVRRRVGSD